MTRFHITALPVLAFVALAAPALAQDAGLYQEVANPDASFVRVIDAGTAMAMIQSTRFDSVEAGVTPYVVIEGQAEVQIVSGQTAATAAILPATFYSYIIGADGTGTLVTDTITRSPAQADVSFYNLSDIPSADLYVPAAKAVAIGGVAANSGGSVALKAPLTLDFEVKQGDTVLATVPAVGLVRREGIAIVLSGTAGTYTATVTPNALSTN